MPKINFLKSLLLLIGLSLTFSLHAVEYTPFQKVILDYEGNAYITDITRSQIVKISALDGTAEVIAGKGQVGFSGDGGLATDACLYVPASLAFDLHGNLYIADAGNSRIRKVDAATGIISTVAGNGQFGFNGDHQYALDTQLNMPYDLLIDGQNLYIADSNNHRIRKFNLDSGIITTVAGNGNAGFSGDGGLATEASLNWPDGISLDAMGNLYISDALNHRIRKVNAATGLIESLNEEQSEQARRESHSQTQSAESDTADTSTSSLSKNGTYSAYLTLSPDFKGGKQTFYASNSLNSRSLKLGASGDRAPPSGTVRINHGSEITNDRSVLLTLTCHDDRSGCAEVRISSDEQQWSDWLPHHGSLLWQLEDQEGEQSLYVQFKDHAGKSGASAQTRITLDRIPPAPTVLLQSADSGLIGKGKSRIKGVAEPHSSIEILLDNRPLALISSSADGRWSLNTELSNEQWHQLTVVVIDQAGNRSTSEG
ncbi:MAG: hypothetical protein Q9O24_10805 [Gammaproteobacteria bacterium]|nr:hypothetical protein [Gammaproteobacteria bacterium]